MNSLKYSEVGISYASMDPWKRACQKAAEQTSHNLVRHGLSQVNWSRGESAYLIESDDCYLGHVQEGLGTKNLVADEMYKLTGRSYYDWVAQDVVAMILNDLSTLGVSPVSVALHIAAGNSDWFLDQIRAQDFIRGFQSACNIAGAVWGPGESPTLPNIVTPDSVEISGSAFGIARPKKRLIKPAIEAGDAIVLVASSGIHANGLTLARRIAQQVEGGYLTPVDATGVSYGECLLRPTLLYSALIDRLIDEQISVHYAVHITGHGWRKLMRHTLPFAYIVEELPEPPQPFPFIQHFGPVSDEEAYANFNMGAGFALYVPPHSVTRVESIAKELGFLAWEGGHVETSTSHKVELRQKRITFSGDTLGVR